MSKQYLRCINSTNCKLQHMKVYLCKEDPLEECEKYAVWDEENNFMGSFNKERFTYIGDTKPDGEIDYGLRKLRDKVQEYENRKKELKVIKEDINSIYKQVGKQLDLGL